MNAVTVLLIIIGALAVTAAAPRGRGFQINLLIVVLAGAVSFVPGMPRLELDSELILGVVVPPLLYAAALDFSFISFARNLRPIVALGIGLVIVTTLTTGLLASWLLPSLTLGAAFVLAAVISPPDTVTAITHGREMGLPRRVIAILTGESLVNDATALAIFATTTAAVTGGHTLISSPPLLFLYGAAVGALVGLAIGATSGWIRARLHEPSLATAVNILVPFTAYLVAEHLEGSGVLAVVFAALAVSSSSNYPGTGRRRALSYRIRLQERQVWPLINTLLEAFVFAYIGLQLRFLLDDLADTGESLPATLLGALLLLLTVIAVRVAWAYITFGKWSLERRLEQRHYAKNDPAGAWPARRRTAQTRSSGPYLQPAKPLGPKETLLVAWTGMRGIITLAAAAGIPLTTHTGADFPGRATIQFIAFTITVGTLLIQGLTLPALARTLSIDTSAEEAEEAAQLAEAELLARAAALPQPSPDPRVGFDAQRAALVKAVAAGDIDDDAARTVLHRIDLHQAALEASAVQDHD
ncbi:cation:proton antiporter [Streptomyces sp. NPDC051554]|uniref:cation:proton antiporter n=1 Tax=Streptomyces sp. NPDC051554 TaxID=3365656 RepID=UPI0037A07C8C